MSDRELVGSILTYCKDDWAHTINYFIICNYVKFNDNEQCIHLDLFDEKLTEIPDEMLELKHLEYLDLNFNKLTHIPDELSYIEELYMCENPIFKSKDKVELLFNKGILNDR